MRRGTRDGCLFNGCLGLAMTLVLLLTGILVWQWTQPARDRAAAEQDLARRLHDRTAALRAAARDGAVSDQELVEVFGRDKPAPGLVGLDRRSGGLTAYAQLAGLGPPRTFIFVTEETVTGCYAFRIDGRDVTVDERPTAQCALPPRQGGSLPGRVSDSPSPHAS
ncbi:hypothetical protein ABT160_38340 [Streptomyces sp. NPDC001941]|uniref:hypothetical protein n=1 Tax=Streptomyces sp. NPDC001941 TaxID=3154659 RepID=UPI00332B71AE